MGTNRYNEKMEECEELKEELADLRLQMQDMMLQMEQERQDKHLAEAEAKKLRMQEKQAQAKSAGPVDKKNLSGPSADVDVIRQGYLMKASGGKKDASGKKIRTMGSMRVKWERRWFILVEGVDLDGDCQPQYHLLAIRLHLACLSMLTALPWLASSYDRGWNAGHGSVLL